MTARRDTTPVALDKAALANLGESIDRITTIDLTGRGVVHALSAAARAAQGGGPSSSRAGQRLAQALGPGRYVLISTCMPVGLFPHAEQDGPVGAATLARALVLSFGAKPVIVTEERNVELVSQVVRAAGLYAFPLDAARSEPTACAVLPFTLDQESAAADAASLLDDLAPAAAIAIERAGANEHGRHHSALGRDVSQWNSKQDVLFEAAKARGVLTIGIGDGGNELGCGLIRDAVIEHVPVAATCRCPCQGSVVPSFVPDALVIASVSNWGAYALEAMLAAISGRPFALHDAATDERVHVAAAMAGANNDGPRLLEPGSDAVPARYHGYVLELMRLLVETGRDLGGLYKLDRWPWVTGR